MNRILLLTIIGVLITGIASADVKDVPKAGITPDSPLYMFERVSESLALGVAQTPLIGSAELEAKIRANQASERLAEARAMADRSKSEQVEKLIHQYTKNMNRSTEIISRSRNSDLKHRMNNISGNHVESLERIKKRTPEKAQTGIQKAIENSKINQNSVKNIPENRGNKGENDSAQNKEANRNPRPQENRSEQKENKITGEGTISSSREQRSNQQSNKLNQKTENKNESRSALKQENNGSADRKDNRP